MGTFLPCVPNLDLVVNQKEMPNESRSYPILNQVLVKCREDVADMQGDLETYESGKRSAIVVDSSNQSFIRLKGCGNLDEGFPLEPMAYPFGS